MDVCVSCGAVGQCGWSIDLVDEDGIAWNWWWACSEACAVAFTVAQVVSFVNDADGLTYRVNRP